MNFDLSDDHRAIQDSARVFAKRRLLPTKKQALEEEKFPKELLQEMGDLGFLGCPFPEKYGGTESGFLAQVLITEEITRVFWEISSVFNMQLMTVPFTILNWGNDEQRDNYIRNTITCRKIGYFGLTEPNAASDAAGIETTAKRDGDEYILNGSKIWITFAPFSDYGIVFARTAPDRYKGLSCFVVDTKTPGLEIVEMKSKFLSPLSSPGEIYFEDCRIPASALLGQEGQGFAILSSALNYGRLCVAARSVGIAQACLDRSVSYAEVREQFQQKIGSFQSVKALIADMAVEIEAARMLVLRNAWSKDQGRTAFRESSYSKYYAAEVAHRASQACLKIHGAYSFHDEFDVGELNLVGTMVIVAEGSSFVQRSIIADDVLGWRDADRYAKTDQRYPTEFKTADTA